MKEIEAQTFNGSIMWALEFKPNQLSHIKFAISIAVVIDHLWIEGKNSLD